MHSIKSFKEMIMARQRQRATSNPPPPPPLSSPANSEGRLYQTMPPPLPEDLSVVWEGLERTKTSQDPSAPLHVPQGMNTFLFFFFSYSPCFHLHGPISLPRLCLLCFAFLITSVLLFVYLLTQRHRPPCGYLRPRSMTPKL